MSNNPFEDFRRQQERAARKHQQLAREMSAASRRQKQEASQIVKEYRQLRSSFLASLARRKRAGFNVSHISVPKIPKNITAASVRAMIKAIQKYQYDVKHSSAEGSIQRQRKRRYDAKKQQILEKRRASLESKRTLAIEDKSSYDETVQRNIAREQNAYQGKKFMNEQLAGLPSFEGKAVDDLMDIIDKALENTGDTLKQDAYFRLVEKRAEIAQNFFENMGVNDPELRKLYSYNLEKTYERAASLLERYIWYDSDGGYNNPDVSSLQVIKELMTLYTKDEMEAKKAKLSVDLMSMQADEQHEKYEEYKATVREAQRQYDEEYRAFVKDIAHIANPENF